MKRILSFLLLALAATTVAMGQQRVQGISDTQRLLGYTLTDEISISGAAFGQAGTYSIGAALEPAQLAPYKGCTIVGIRIAASLDLGRTRTFVYDFTGTAFNPIVEQKQRLYEGWNIVSFNGDGYQITGDETLFFGYDYVETQAMVDAEEGGMACNGEETEGAFYLYGDYGQGEGLYTISGAGCLCVQLIVDISTLPLHDMAVTYLDGGFKYKLPGTSFEVMAYVSNIGRADVESYQLACQIDDDAPLTVQRNETVGAGHSDSWVGDINLPQDIATGHHTLRVFVNSIDGEPFDGQAKGLETHFAIYRDSLQRQKAYLEVYTDQTSPYSAMLDESIAFLEQSFEPVCVVNVHRPGTLLAVSDAAYLTQLYAYTYPSFTVNRSYFPGEAYVAYDMNDYLPVVGKEMTGAILGDLLWQDLMNPAFASLQLTGSFDDATRLLTIEASGKLLPEAQRIYGDVALTLMLTENGVKSRQVVYNSSTQTTGYNQNYLHDHVLRGYMTPATGSLLNTDGETFKAAFTTTLNTAWNVKKMSVVGLLTKATADVTAESLPDMDVINAETVQLASLNNTTKIADTGNDRLQEHATAGSFTLEGQQVAKAHRGVIITNGRKVLAK